jgi:hypothetical protein
VSALRLPGLVRPVFSALFVCPTPGCAGACAQSASAAALKGRSTPEYAATRAKLAAQLPYRQAAQLLADLLPVSGGTTLTSHGARHKHPSLICDGDHTLGFVRFLLCDKAILLVLPWRLAPLWLAPCERGSQ